MVTGRRVQTGILPKRNIVIVMAVQTRSRGEAKSKTALLAKVDPAVKAKVERIAATLHISQAAAVEYLLEGMEVDGAGRPTSWTAPRQIDVPKELPLQRTA